MKNIIIVGAGLSGLAAGVKLASAGYRVRILEQGPLPGGRTYSFREKQSGDILDNGQHLLLDCYTDTLKYISLIGTQNYITIEPELKLTFVHPAWGSAHVRVSGKVPPRAALIKGLSGYSFLSFRDRMKLLKIGHTLYSADESYLQDISQLSVEEWLREMKQSERLKKCFWYPLAIAIMNESLDLASAEVFVRTMKIGVFDTKGPARIITPLRGLSEVFINPAVTFISKNNGHVDCHKRVVDLSVKDDTVNALSVKDGEPISGDAFILTGQPIHMQPLLDTAAVDFGRNSLIDYVPIITCNIWFDQEVDIPPRTGMIDTAFHWVFKKDQSFAESEGHGYVSLVMSGAREYVGKQSEVLLSRAVEELRACFPSIRDANVKYYRIIKERRATISITPKIQPLRPDNGTKFKNLFIAGDWTQTLLPATIEGAIMSGFRAADRVMESV